MLETRSNQPCRRSSHAVVEGVLGRIPPLWPLTDYVAVNPFLGYADRPIGEAAGEISDALGASVLPPVEFFRSQMARGNFGRDDVTRAAARLGLDANKSYDLLDPARPPAERPASQIATFAERHDALHGTQWEIFLRASIARFCAVFADGGGVWWHLDLDRGLWGTWREAAAVDRAPELTGLVGYRAHVEALPATATEAIDFILDRIAIPLDDLEAYLYRLIGGLFGWASYFRRESWKADTALHGPLLDLLAIRLAADSFFASDALSPTTSLQRHAEDESARLVLQEAMEDAYVKRIARELADQPASAAIGRDSLQAVFCIDVRSEPLRRHLESLDPSIRTLGFAGFFGIPIAVDGESARCPVLLAPSVRVDVEATDSALLSGIKKFQNMPPSAFSFVETAGLVYGAKMLKDTCVGDHTKDPEAHAAFELPGADLGARVAAAAGILKNMSIGEALARIVLLCGHHGRSANNPQAAGLDCGACGGHGGGINARVATAILNDPSVRLGLREGGTIVPEDTVFVAAVHDTSTDVVSLLDEDRIPESHREDVARLRAWLDAAGAKTRAERATSLGLPASKPHWLMRLLDRRARHWAEVRPEWALARNAAFIAARRDRTRGINLAGRSFLHEYDAAADADSSVLTLILSAPMVVASWINLQYFASTVDNDIFGAGTKTIHNRVGSLGVVLGNGGDLRTGLAKQSVHGPDGAWFHEPLRLQVIVEAPRAKIDEVLERQDLVRNLIENGWVRLFALTPDSPALHLRRADGSWEPVHGSPA
jgi:uncharacterized protein YbcC (UPF0753/DUF2309 family)